MNSDVKTLLEAVRDGTTSVDEALLELKKAPFADIGYAKVDLHRAVRQGAAEVIYGAGKTREQIAGILKTMKENGQNRVLITRMTAEAADFVGKSFDLDYRPDSKVGIVGGIPEPTGSGTVLIATGAAKENAIRGLIMDDVITTHNPSSMLKMHENVYVVIDEELANLVGYKA